MAFFDFSQATEFEIYWHPRFLRDSISSTYFHVYGGVNHLLDCPSDDFYLKSSLFKIDDRGIAPGKVKFFEILLNGSKNILVFKNPYSIKIKYLKYDKLFSAMPATPELFQIRNIDHQEFMKTEQLARLAIFSLADEKISHILQVASIGNNFINLFKIMETMKADKEAQNNGFILDAQEITELKRFEYTANSPAVIGIYARHGVNESRFKTSKTLMPMSLAEAHNYVSSIFIRYLNTKYSGYINWI